MRQGTETRRLSGQVLVRLAANERRAVSLRANLEQVSIAAVCRDANCKALNLEMPQVKSRARPPELIVEIAALRQIMAKLNDTLLQAIVATRREGPPQKSKRVRPTPLTKVSSL